MNNPNNQYPDQNHHPDANDCNECKEVDNPTQNTINRERQVYCQLLYDAKGATSQQETKFDGENTIYKEKKCMFKHTEENYQRYRNLEIIVGSEVLQTTESVKGNVDRLKKWNADLNTLLIKISKSVKDTKSKFSDLKDAGCKLESSIKDKCNAAQWKALTGKTSENCKDNPTEPIPACKEAATIIEELICKPKGLILDVDSLFQSSSDIVGIQVFSNIDILDPLQKDLDQFSKDFEKHIADTMKTRETDLKKLQDELIKAVKDITKSAVDRNQQRADFEGLYDAIHYMCCPVCGCVREETNPNESKGNDQNNGDKDCYNNCPPRLKDCETSICDICKDIEKAFCCKPEKKPLLPATTAY